MKYGTKHFCEYKYFCNIFTLLCDSILDVLRIPNPPQSNSDCKHGNKFDTTSYKLITNYPWSLWNIAVLSDLESCN